MSRSSRLPGFYKQTTDERARIVAGQSDLTLEERTILTGESGLTPALADRLIENVVGVFGMPLGIAANFVVNGRDVLIPMAVEEPSVVAAASHIAKLVRSNGGFTASATPPEMIGQIQILDLADLLTAKQAILADKADLLAAAAQTDPFLASIGGGPRDIEVRILNDTAAGPMLIVHLIVDCRDAMGANTVNTACETLAPLLERLTGGRVGLKILSNLADRRLARAECTLPSGTLAFEGYPGEQVVTGVIEAWAFAAADPYRAATHNKGIMNGIDPVVIATGNDWRAIEAGAHAYAARSGRYTSLTTWSKTEDGSLHGKIELPMAVGIVGGTTRAHPAAQVALKILGVEKASELAGIIAAVGLAQNLGALRALATEGIQKGHMALHARQIAISAGAADDQIDMIVQCMLQDKQINLDYARKLLEQ
jgi:hydroxymethylglutaryl-CoA reductase